MNVFGQESPHISQKSEITLFSVFTNHKPTSKGGHKGRPRERQGVLKYPACTFKLDGRTDGRLLDKFPSVAQAVQGALWCFTVAHHSC